MHNLKHIVCLASSGKLTGRCIAGREWIEEQGVGNWIRPVSARENEEVSVSERQYKDGSDPRVLDIINIPVLEPRPRDYQTENWLLDPECCWEKTGTFSRPDLPELVDPIAPLWIDGQSTYHGGNDRILLASADSVSNSLRLIHVEDLNLAVFKYVDVYGKSKRRVQGRFTHAGTGYKLSVTDPEYKRAYLAKLDGSYCIGECYLTISLGKPYDGYCYKLIAAIIRAE